MTKSVFLVFFVLIAGIPLRVFAVQDVVLEQDLNVVIENPGTTLIIQPATVDQIVVNDTNVVITMSANGDAVTITSADKYTFSVSGITNPGISCGASISTLVLPAQTTATAVTVTPLTICPPSAPSALPLKLAEAPPATAGKVVVTASQGGGITITTNDGTTAKLDVPVAAVSQDTEFNISTIAKTASMVAASIAAVPFGSQIVGSNIYDYTATSAGVAVKTFSENITIEFTYTDAQIAGLSLASLKVHFYDTISGEWKALETTVNSTTKTITAVANHLTYFAVFGSLEAAEEVSLLDDKGNIIIDGDLITTANSFDIYIVKLIGEKKFKRLILNPDIFNSYGHLKWGNVKTVSQAVQDAYMLSDLVLEVNPDGSVVDPKVYKVSSAPNSDIGQKQWLNMTATQFVAAGYDWDAVYKINNTEAGPDFYPESAYITE